MPYILAEILNPAGGKELIAAPSTWIQRQEDGLAYVYWPWVRNIRKLRELFENEYSTPSEIWEKYECEILCRNIPSLESADKMIETMEMEDDQSSEATPPTDDAQATQPSIHIRQEQQTNHRSHNNVQKLLSCINRQLADSDPLGDVKSYPELIDLMTELKRMIQTNQEEIRKRLKEGFGCVEKSLMAQKLETNAMQFAMERMEPNEPAKIPAFDRSEKFKVDMLCDVKEVEKFEERLNDDDFLKKVCGWIDTSLGLVRESEHRMHILLDQIIDRKLFTTFSWTGAGKDKHALNVLKNILGLFEYAGTTPMQRVDYYVVERFMRKKLHNSVTRAKAKGVRKSVPHSRKRVRRNKTSTLPAKYALVTAKSQKTPSGTKVRAVPRQDDQREQSPLNTSTSSSYSGEVAAAADNLSGMECVALKDDPAAYIDVLEGYENMVDYRRL